jgi:acyl-CoA synthetase (AMP-forming)/AMP-acid ligase II
MTDNFNGFNFSTLVGLLRYRAIHQPDQKAFTFLRDGETESGSLSYQELDRQARAIAVSLQFLGATGERALLLYPSGLEFIAAFFGCLYAGVIAVPAYPPRKKQEKLSRLKAIAENAQAKVALTTQFLLPNIKGQLAQNSEMADLQLVGTDNIAIDLTSNWQEPEITNDTLAFLQYTSGSTGTPKGVMVSHGNILHNQQMIKMGFQHTEKTIFVGWLPLFHDMGLIGNMLQPLYLGIPCILMPPEAFLQEPVRWLQAISRYRATTSGGPNLLMSCVFKKLLPSSGRILT